MFGLAEFTRKIENAANLRLKKHGKYEMMYNIADFLFVQLSFSRSTLRKSAR